MANIGYHISHEQFAPGELLKLAKKAEEAGFSFCLSSDHYAPWNHAQGQSGFAWSWLGAALSVTSLNYGIVTCPSFRYHPAIIAQASATLDEMFPGRFWIAIGSGQALSESITGEYWPPKADRNKRLKASAEMIRALWNGEKVTSDGPVRVTDAELYTFPKSEMLITGAALSPATAKWMAPWADRLITVSQSEENLKSVVDAWKDNGGENKPMMIKVQLSFDRSYNDALQGAYEQWRTNIFPGEIQSELRNPSQFEQAAHYVKPGDMEKMVNISHEPGNHIDLILKYAEMGFSYIVLHNVNRNQEYFIESFGQKVLPELKDVFAEKVR